MYIHCHPIVQWLSSVYQVYVKCFDNKILRPLPLLKFLLPQRKNRAFRLCLSGNNLATHKFSSNTIFASILQAQSPENIEYSTFLGLLYHSNSSADRLNWLLFSNFLWIYYPYSSKSTLMFVSVQIFRAKKEPKYPSKLLSFFLFLSIRFPKLTVFLQSINFFF